MKPNKRDDLNILLSILGILLIILAVDVWFMGILGIMLWSFVLVPRIVNHFFNAM